VHLGPSWRGLFNTRVDLADGRTAISDEAYLTRSMMDPQVDLVRGFAPLMPTYRGVLGAPETAALVEYIKSLDAPIVPTVPLPRLRGSWIARDGGAATDANFATPTDAP
jgi:cytochrome c oxidase subunit 2